MGLFNFARVREKPISGDMVFKDNESAFDYACKYMTRTMEYGELLLALVTQVDSLSDGRQTCTLKLESDNGGRELLLCETLNQQVPILAVGDLVAYQIVRHHPESRSKISYVSTMGFIAMKLRPVWSIQHSGWREWI